MVNKQSGTLRSSELEAATAMDRLLRTLAHIDARPGAGHRAAGRGPGASCVVVVGRGGGGGPAAAGRASARREVIRYDDKYVVVVDLPGVGRKNVDVTMEPAPQKLGLGPRARVLTVTASRTRADPKSERHGERRHTMRLPEDVNEEAVAARMEDGALVLTLPRVKTPGVSVPIE